MLELKKLLWSIFLLLLTVVVQAQLNIKVGYTGGYATADEINDIINRFNDERPFLEKKLNEMHLMSGLDLGVRYRVGSAALELFWTNGTAESEAFGTNNGSPFSERLLTSLRSYGIGLDNFIGDFGFGAALISRRLKMQTDITGFNSDRQLFTSTGLASRFHLFFQVKSRSVSLTIKPYYEFPWDKLNVSGLEREYFPSSTTPVENFDTDMSMFGISFLFYNGPQR
jgi:hypothetical protein